MLYTCMTSGTSCHIHTLHHSLLQLPNFRVDMDSHLSVILDLSPLGWCSSKTPSTQASKIPPLSSFLSQVLTFINAHLAQSAENSLAVFGALPSKRYVRRPHF